MEKMTAKITGLTTTKQECLENITSSTFDLNAGYAANICYTQKDLDAIKKEDIDKTLTRSEGAKISGHHSVFGHDHISIYLKNIPKIIAMLINNEKEYNTSEKSARYTKMLAEGKEYEMYIKWCEKLEQLIKTSYPKEKYLTDTMIKKKAQENARYMLSIFTRTKMLYTTSYRQLNYLYNFTNRMINDDTNIELVKALKPYLEEFRDCLESTEFIDKSFEDNKDRRFSLIQDFNSYDEQFGRAYSTNYLASFSALANLQRHRSVDYSLSIPSHKEYYIPELLRQDYDFLIDEWLNDISNSTEYPQGMLVNVNETGTYENLVLKLKERLCTAAQLEVAEVSKELLERYIEELRQSPNLSDQYIYAYLSKYNSGARCTFGDFECTQKCEFSEGVKLVRKI